MAAMPSVSGVGSASDSSSSATSSTSGNATVGTVPDAQVKYRVPLAPSLDGNTVDEQLEQSAFAENSVRYQATLTFLNSKLRDLMTAITGSVAPQEAVPMSRLQHLRHRRLRHERTVGAAQHRGQQPGQRR